MKQLARWSPDTSSVSATTKSLRKASLVVTDFLDVAATSVGRATHDKKVEDVIPLFLNESRSLLLLDGLDELRKEHEEQITEEIIKLGRHLKKSKIIVSCRSGDYARNMEGFTVNEICPLTKEQVVAIKDRWLGTDGSIQCKKIRFGIYVR